VYLFIVLIISAFIFSETYLFKRLFLFDSALNQRSSEELVEFFYFVWRSDPLSLIFGYGPTYIQDMGFSGDSSLLGNILNFGLIILVPIFSFVIFELHDSRGFSKLFYVFIICAILWHRPGTFYYPGYLVFFYFVGISSLISYEKQ